MATKNPACNEECGKTLRLQNLAEQYNVGVKSNDRKVVVRQVKPLFSRCLTMHTGIPFTFKLAQLRHLPLFQENVAL